MSERSTQPIFWLMFGAGGMLSALFGAMLVLITGILLPLGIVFAPDALTYDHALAFARNWAGKAFLFVVITFFLWHGMHRIYHTLHDFGVKSKMAGQIGCYGIALMATIAAALALLRIGF
jgi:fumarate reductase subunit D